MIEMFFKTIVNVFLIKTPFLDVGVCNIKCDAFVQKIRDEIINMQNENLILKEESENLKYIVKMETLEKK